MSPKNLLESFKLGENRRLRERYQSSALPDTKRLSPRPILPLVERRAVATCPWKVSLKIAGTPIHVALEVDNAVVTMGRGVARTYEQTHLDFTQFDAYEAGVSRIHAGLFGRENFLTIQDLGSTNGTLLNGGRLVPYQHVPLRDGDIVMLGDFQIQIAFLERAETR